MAGSRRSGTTSARGRRGDPPASPLAGRELRSQGRRTMAALLAAGMEVLAEKGYHAARVDDVVRVADVSHGTFYLYFSNKEDLFRALAVQCADEMTELASSLGPVPPGEEGVDVLREWVSAFIATYRRYGVVIRAWMEDQVSSRDLARLGAKSFSRITGSLVARLRDERGDDADVELAGAALLAMIERSTYFLTSRDLPFGDDELAATLARIAHRGFFHPSA